MRLVIDVSSSCGSGAVGWSQACGARWAVAGGPWPVGRWWGRVAGGPVVWACGLWDGGVGVWQAVVGMGGRRSCGRAPAQSILHASWMQDVADRRIARSSPRSDMEASTVSYLGAALIERGAEARRGGV